MSERIFYAIGDIHGECERLRELHRQILYHRRGEGAGRPATLVHLGDYVDRGPDSAGVVSYLIEFEREHARSGDLDVRFLMGNHEQLMLDALLGEDASAVSLWLSNGGQKTIDSYAAAAPPGTPLHESVPTAHVDWMENLPTLIEYQNEGLLFVHAGVRPDKFPDCDDQVLLWTRARAFMDDSHWPANARLDGKVVVHGHTPTDDDKPYVGRRRINLDTGAVYGGPLTAGVFMVDRPLEFFSA
ncbi:MAG: metallophosphoesterase family protein [Maricaulaceae bacterium]|jgi:serine/threonine protein phosphatase 1